jgi:DNA-binding transcriptional MerR regulator
MGAPLEPAHLFFTIKEVAERYRVEIRTVEGWRYRGVGPRGIKIGGRVLFSIAELAKFEQLTGF